MQVKNEDDEFDWGIIVNFKKESEVKKKENPLKSSPGLVVDILLHLKPGSNTQKPRPCPAGVQGDVEVVPVVNTLISHISSLRVYYPKDLRPLDSRKSVLKTITVSHFILV
jgi:ATP-dependent RNA helicase DOB1